MNPIPPQSPSQSGGQVVVVGGGSSLPFHQHSGTSLSSPVGDDQLPERLQSGAPRVNHLDDALDSGWWSADILTANSPDGTAGVGATILYTPDPANYRAQVFYEVVSPFRAWRRTQNFGSWTDWVRTDGPEVETLTAVAPFSGSVSLRRVGGLVHADGLIARAVGSSSSYTTCTGVIPAGFEPAADTELAGGLVFNTVVSYQFQALAAGGFQVRMSGAAASTMAVSGHWQV